jgi:hypothetical protein
VYHRGLTSASQNIYLNLTNAASTATSIWNSTAPTSTEFSVGTATVVNASGGTYVAYLFAHDAGGFGAAGTDNVITCGSYTGNGSATGPTITLGYEPQWILIKRAVGGTAGWILHDTMRGLPTGGNSNYLQANASDAETGPANYVDVNATGFQLKTTGASWNASGSTYIYIAIRRPMKTPTSGTSVYNALTYTATNTPRYLSGAGFPPDAFLWASRSSGDPHTLQARLTEQWLQTTSTAAESTQTFTAGSQGDKLSGWQDGAYWYDSFGYTNYATTSDVIYYFRRATGFFDVVCDTGTASGHTINHGLGVVPELMIRKKRNSATNSDWVVWHTLFSGTNKYLYLNSTAAEDTNAAFWTTTAPTSTVFSVGTGSRVNNSGDTYVTYLFATVAGVSKVGSYTGTGTTLTIDCGFTAGARFVMIKRTSSTGDWYVWDTARGIISGNDPYLLLNSTAAEVTNTDYIDPVNSGFQISSTAPVQINGSGGTFIYLAIA